MYNIASKNTTDCRCDLCHNARKCVAKISWHECTLSVEQFNECVKSNCAKHFKKGKPSNS